MHRALDSLRWLAVAGLVLSGSGCDGSASSTSIRFPRSENDAAMRARIDDETPAVPPGLAIRYWVGTERYSEGHVTCETEVDAYVCTLEGLLRAPAHELRVVAGSTGETCADPTSGAACAWPEVFWNRERVPQRDGVIDVERAAQADWWFDTAGWTFAWQDDDPAEALRVPEARIVFEEVLLENQKGDPIRFVGRVCDGRLGAGDDDACLDADTAAGDASPETATADAGLVLPAGMGWRAWLYVEQEGPGLGPLEVDDASTEIRFGCEGALQEIWRDADGDGFGAGEARWSCGVPAGWASVAGDCDDGDPTLSPGRAEVCDGVDNDCDGAADDADPEGASSTTVYYWDADEDGYGSQLEAEEACTAPEGYVDNADDCDDANSLVYPAAAELCDLEDNNCDGQVDEGFDQDADDDGYPTCANDCDDESADVHPNALESCNGADDDCDRSIDEGFDLDGDGYTSCNGDCDDSYAYVSPAGTELCDGYDNNCDGQVDENYDMDQDGYSACQGDCNEAAPDVNPGIEELCNGRDDNCNEQIDEAFDQDNDGVTTCDGDCNDTDATIRPGAGETCNSKDDDCDGQIDEDFDQDVDSYSFCEGDCNDNNASIHPGAQEFCDSVDNNCNNQTDEGVKTTYYADVDRDTYGSTSNSTQACSKPSGYVATGTDCNDADPTVYPGAPEGTEDADSNGTLDGDGLDNDCDGIVDEGTDLYDDDIDGYTEEDGDCDDSDGGVNPGEAEGTDLDGDGLPDPDGVDNNCNLEVDEGTVAYDDDGDGFSELEGDCDDGDVEVYPGGIEVFDGLDNDCDGQPETEILLADAFSFRGAQSGAMAGFSVAGPGDLDGDGLSDLVIGSPRYNLDKGAVHVVLGHESWGRNLTLSTNSVTLNEEAVGAQAGYSVSAAGDLNSDGYPDFAVGAPYYDSANYADAGTAYVVFGRAAGWGNSAFTSFANGSITGLYSQVYLGISLAGGGNVNGDSFDDLLVGAPWPGGTGYGFGLIMIVPGKSTNWTFNMQAGTLSKIAGNQAEATGYSMALTGHTDSDGYDDIVAGGQYDPDQAGDAWFIPGAAKFTAGTSYGPPDVSGKRYYGTTLGEFVGDSVAAAGDVNGDGYDDFLVGRRGDGNGTDAKAYLYLGPDLPGTGAAQSTASVRFTGSSTDKCPCVVSGLGDIDADGYADLAIGVTKNTDDAAAGKVYLFYGGPSGTFATSTPLAESDMPMYGETSNDQAGAALCGAGDLNGDGFDDFVIGAPTNDQAGIDSGKAYVIFGFPRL